MIKKEWLIAAVLTFITISCWIAFDVLHKRAEVEIPQDLQKTIEPINPNFNTNLFETSK